MAGETKLVKNFVTSKIHSLTKSEHESAVKATLAILRRGIGKAPGSMPELWKATLEGLHEDLLSKDGRPTYGEWATYTALTLYALHQQGKDIKTQCMNRESATFGNAMNLLAYKLGDKERVLGRFNAAATASSIEELAHHLRGLIQLLKANDIALDYPELASDLFLFQIPTARDSVRLRWGQDFYRIPLDGNKREDDNQNEKQ